MKPTFPDDVQGKATLSSSRRNFIKGARLALGAGVAFGLSTALGRNAHALAVHTGNSENEKKRWDHLNRDWEQDNTFTDYVKGHSRHGAEHARFGGTWKSGDSQPGGSGGGNSGSGAGSWGAGKQASSGSGSSSGNSSGSGSGTQLAWNDSRGGGKGGDRDRGDSGDSSRGGKGGEHCFLAGTRIQTESGLVAVENLSIGDTVLTASGVAKPVKWIGKRTTSQAPVKIAAFAIDGKAPVRDLYVTPRHAVYIDGFLVPAINLVNDITIVAGAKSELSIFEYYHVEFETHEVIEAEGLQVESYLHQAGIDFDNADEYLALYGLRTQPMTPFAPVLSFKSTARELASYARSTIACVYDVRQPIDRIRDRIADQAEFARAA